MEMVTSAPKGLCISLQAMRTLLFILLFTLCFSGIGKAQKVSLKGYLKDATNGEILIGATIFIPKLNIGTSSNVYGFYSLSVPQGRYEVVVSYIGYLPLKDTIDLRSDLTQNFELNPESDVLEEVVVEGAQEEVMSNVTSTEMSVAKVDMKTMKKMPAFLGEVDVIRSIQLLPGVSSVGEGATGFNVRGGSIDQNLILLDEAPVYNSSHVFGFFSVFNPDAIRDVKLYKGGIPAPYGGRLASLLDVRLKEGNSKRFSGSGGVGTIFSRLTLEGPIVKDKGSWIIAGRRSYIDVLLRPFGDIGGVNFQENGLHFYDLSAKANYNLGTKNKVFLSGYLGRDVFTFSGIGGFNYGNATLSGRWNSILSDKLFMNITAFYSNYDYEFGIDVPPQQFDWKANVISYNLKPQWSWFLNPENTITFGGQSTLYTFKPGDFQPRGNAIFNPVTVDDRWGWENAIFVQNEQKLSPRLSVQYGLRVSNFNYIGALNRSETKVYEFGEQEAPNKRRELDNVDTVGRGDLIANYYRPEPRFNFTYALNEFSSIKGSYMRTAQYLQLMSNTTASIPFDIWLPATNNILPQTADQVALGYFRNFGVGNDYETSAEVYYKSMDNQINFADGAQLLLNEEVEGEVLSGIGRAYGIELYAKKNKGKLTGWISYTLARTERQINGLNSNEWFPARFDQTHNFSAVAIYEINRKWSVSANFSYISGTPKTLATQAFVFDGLRIPHTNSARNNFRLPAYHRLDLAATMKLVKKEKLPEDISAEKWYRRIYYNSELVFSIYNAYQPLRIALLGEQNPAARNALDIFPQSFFDENTNDDVDPRRNPDTIYKQPGQFWDYDFVRFAVFGGMIPSVTYNFEF